MDGQFEPWSRFAASDAVRSLGSHSWNALGVGLGRHQQHPLYKYTSNQPTALAAIRMRADWRSSMILSKVVGFRITTERKFLQFALQVLLVVADRFGSSPPTSPKPATPPLLNIGNQWSGKWVQTSRTNVDGYFKLVGLGYLLRKMIAKATVQEEVRYEEPRFCITEKRWNGDYSFEFTVGQPFDYTEMDGAKVSTTSFWDGTEVVLQKELPYGAVEIRRRLTQSKRMVETTKLRGEKGRIEIMVTTFEMKP